MKKIYGILFIAVITSSVSAMATPNSDQKYNCVSPSDETPAISFSIHKDASTGLDGLSILIEENDGSKREYSLEAKPLTIAQIKNHFLDTTKILPGIDPRQTYVSGDMSFYVGNAILVNLFQQRPGLKGAFSGVISLQGNVYTFNGCAEAK